ncbi:MAG: S9 family peptidase [Planctomycetota bacterium]|jgi:dipeptidyl aminopeptidase/acylaminoacyl peptidase
MRDRWFAPVLALGVLAVAGLVHGANPIVTSDLLKLRRITSIDVADDGSRAVFSVRSIGPRARQGEGAGALVNQSHLFVLDLRDPGARPRQYTHGARIDVDPQLSPDGKWIAFVRGGFELEEPGRQVWIMPVDGGEARPLAGLPDGAGSPRWSPDGLRLLVTSRVSAADLPGDPPWAEPGRSGRAGAEPRADGSRDEIRAWLDANASGSDPSVIERLNFQGEMSLRGPQKFRQLFLYDPRRPDAPPAQLTQAFRDHDAPAFMPDGRSIVYATVADPDVHPDRQIARCIRRIDLDGRNDRVQVAVDGWSVSSPRPSRDGSIVAISGRRIDQPAHRQRRLGIASTTEPPEDPVWLTESFDASVRSFRWMPTKSSLLFSAARRGGFPLFTMGLGLLEPATLVERDRGLPAGVHAFDANAGVIVYALTTAANPCVLRVRDGNGDRLAYDANAWVADRDLSRPTMSTITRPDGTQVQYWLMEPTRRSPERTYPLVLEIHGGPSSMWGPGEFTMWHEFQLLCSWGYGVVYANPRGSGGYGYEFQRANFQNWGEGPSGDVLAAVDDALRQDWIDPDRLVVTGGSYGGYLTAWIVCHDHRFKAAVAQRGVYDLETFFGEGNAWRLVEWSMGGLPWDQRTRAVLRQQSPFTWVNRIRTPLLIMHASRDLRTGVSQSEMMYRALEKLSRPVEYVRYPNAGHDLSRTGDPVQRMDRLNRIIEYFDRAVDNPRRAPRVGAGQ